MRVCKNDELSVEEIADWHPEGILLSPGPGRPKDAGITLSALARFAGVVPIFGVCLGHQSIATHFGASIVKAKRLMHGRVSSVHHDGLGVFDGLPNPLTAMRYHSLIVDRATVPSDLEVSAWTESGEIMGLRHCSMNLEGVQFHPESFLSEAGHALLGNWLDHCRREGAAAARGQREAEGRLLRQDG